MKKNKIIYLIIILAGIMILTANAGICAQDVAQHVPAVPAQIPTRPDEGLQPAITKFFITMMGVLISSVIIWAGLSFYNKFFVKRGQMLKSNGEEDLKTPKTIDDAVLFFIKKNKLK